MFSHFSSEQLFPFILSALLIIVSVFSFHCGFKKTALLLLFSGTFGFGYFMANLDHFLILWDEQFHALVAKNLVKDPFIPVLYDNPVLDYDYRIWTYNHIWLHKQPLFLWQMALSIKIFGINALAIRMPSVIMHALMTLFIFRIGKITSNDKIGFYGALFFALAYFPLELLAGRYPTDHNDFAFLFYLTASFWAWFEYYDSKKKYWLVLIGLFAGFSVLIKWLMGLLIYPVWLICIPFFVTKHQTIEITEVTDKNNTLNDNLLLKSEVNELGRNASLKFNHFYALFSSLIISIIIFLPWQLYIWYSFPTESMYEFSLNSKHLFEVIEGHSGDVWFHFDAIKILYGAGFLIPALILAGLFFYLKSITQISFRAVILSSIILVYGLYTFAATKMVSYCVIVSPFIFLGIGAFAHHLIAFLNLKIKYKIFQRFFGPLALLIACFLFMNISKIEKYHTMWKPLDNCNRQADLRIMKMIDLLKNTLKNEKYVVFTSNIRYGDNIPVMFYTDYLAYSFIPSKDQIEKIKLKSFKIAIINTKNLPPYILKDKEIIIIDL